MHLTAAVLIPKLCLLCSKSRDPRFENLSGKFSTDQFRKQYAFVYDEALPEEKRDLKRQLQVVHIWLSSMQKHTPVVDTAAH